MCVCVCVRQEGRKPKLPGRRRCLIECQYDYVCHAASKPRSMQQHLPLLLNTRSQCNRLARNDATDETEFVSLRRAASRRVAPRRAAPRCPNQTGSGSRVSFSSSVSGSSRASCVVFHVRGGLTPRATRCRMYRIFLLLHLLPLLSTSLQRCIESRFHR